MRSDGSLGARVLESIFGGMLRSSTSEAKPASEVEAFLPPSRETAISFMPPVSTDMLSFDLLQEDGTTQKFDFRDLLRGFKQDISGIKNKDSMTFVLGARAGKTTLVNYLTGKKFENHWDA